MTTVSNFSLLLSVGLLAACSGTDPAFNLSQFSSCDDLEDTIKSQAIEEIRWANAWGGLGGLSFATSSDFAVMESAAGYAMDDSSGSERGYSTTNNQVSGVDELDIMETDGEYIYAVAGDHLVVSDVWPPEEASVVAKLEVEGSPKGLFLMDDGMIAVLSQLGWGESGSPASGRAVPGGQDGLVKVTLFDASMPAAPQMIRETYSRGVLFDARVKEGRLFTVSYIGLRIEAMQQARGKTEEIRAVKNSVLDDWMPLRHDNLRAVDTESWESSEEPICACEDVYGSKRGSGDYFVSVQSLDLTDPTGSFEGSSVLSSLDHIYASRDSIYVVSSEHSEGPWSSYDDSVDSIIHRFKISGETGIPNYQSSGKVPGYTLNQFALDQKDDILRVATTRSSWKGGNGVTNLYVLEDDGDELDIIGKVEDLAQGEQIFAVRYVDDTAYVVTFLQVDPLYTIDLQDPTNPVVRGELKIPGFSNYLHPLEDGSLLGIGLDMDENGWESFGVQISRFDVSDLDNPELADKITLENTGWSAAQSEHHAFNFYAPTASLSVPAYSYDSGESELFVIRAGVGEELGVLGSVGQTVIDTDSSEFYCTDFKRSVVIEGDPEAGGVDTVFGLSNAGLFAAPVDNPEDITVALKYPGIDPCAGRSGYYYW